MARLVVTALTIALLAVPMLGSPASAARPKCNGWVATHVGNDRANVIKGTPGRDVIVAKGGNDRILGRGGRDIICAGTGKDVVRGGAGNDRIFGGGQRDVLKGGAGFDRIDGGRGLDACYVQSDGGTKTRCEDGNLRVRIVAPSEVIGTNNDDVDFRIDVIAKNIGATTLRDVEFQVDWGSINVSCGIGGQDPPITYDLDTLVPGEFELRFILGDCDEPVSGGGQIVVTATATTSSDDPDLTNNEAEATITVSKP